MGVFSYSTSLQYRVSLRLLITIVERYECVILKPLGQTCDSLSAALRNKGHHHQI